LVIVGTALRQWLALGTVLSAAQQPESSHR
jgi:hypothetical protein